MEVGKLILSVGSVVSWAGLPVDSTAESYWDASVHLSPFPDYGVVRPAATSLFATTPSPPRSTVSLPTGSQNEPVLPEVALLSYFILAKRKQPIHEASLSIQ